MPHPPRFLDRPDVRKAVKVALDGLLAAGALLACDLVFSPGPRLAWGLGDLLWLALAVALNLGFRLTRQHYRLTGFKDAVQIALTTIVLMTTTVVVLAVFPEIQHSLTRPVAISASLTTAGAWLLFRGSFRFRHDLAQFGWPVADKQLVAELKRTLIVGAGRTGLSVAKALTQHAELGCKIVGFVDDNHQKQGIAIHGFQVLGTSRQLPEILREHAVARVILALPSASGPAIRRLTALVQPLGVEIKIVPAVSDLLGPIKWRPELRDVSIEDLLRREPVKLDHPSLNLVLNNAVVLITGAGGSIGSELARQITAFRPARVVLLGRGENSLWEIERCLRELFPNQAISLELCDIRDPSRLAHAFQRWHPEVVFHAAAHKHVPYLEAHPEEGVRNNILGTRNVVEAALAEGSRTFVNISTDKAVKPTNVLGATKRIAEQLVLAAASRAPKGHRYMSVRFGNVLGSRGSAVKIFADQIRKGGPITVTHPDMIRYFMTVPEASQLVLQAGILGENARTYVLDMGQPVKIVDLASDMARLSGLVPGQDIEIQFTGIRPGEKMFEELFYDEEPVTTNVHPKVFQASPEIIDGGFLTRSLANLQAAQTAPEDIRQLKILQELVKLVPTYKPSPTGLGRYLPKVEEGGPLAGPPVAIGPEYFQQT